MAGFSRRHAIMGMGWAVAIGASALPALWALSRAIERDHRGRLVDPATGEYTGHLYQLFLMWWLPVLIPVLLLGCACLFLDWRPRDGRRGGGGNGAELPRRRELHSGLGSLPSPGDRRLRQRRDDTI